MKSKRTIKKKICMLAMLSFLACTLFPLNIFNIPKVSADAQEDLNNSLTWAKAYLDRSYTEFNSSYAAMRDLPGLPFVMEDVTDDKWICPAKATQAVQDGNDGPDWGYYGGCGIDVLDYGYDSDRLKLSYRWDTECDSTFDGVVMYVELITLDNVNMKCYANITSKADSDHCALWLDNETVIDPVTVGASFDRTHAYGWFTTRFVVRHGTKIAANMYNALGETDKAEKLLNLWYGSGYTKDTYDGIWGASNSYDYYEGGYPWAANPFVVMPDPDIWGDIPWFQMSQDGTNHPGVPYRSQLQNEVVRMLGFQTGPGISLGKSWWECGFTFKMAWACYLLNKYNTSDSSKLAEAKQLIDDVSWNGLGISSETLRVGPTLISLYSYACYVPYADAEYLAALTKYWQLTGDEFYGERADEVAGILLKVQVKPGDKIRVADSNGDIRLIWRPDNTGGFMCGYKYGGGWDFGSSPFWLADKYFWCTMASGLYNRDYAELSSCGWTNHETTLMSYAALYKYNQTGRTPLTSSVDFTMPFFDAQASTSHSDHGCDSIQADNSGNIRTFLSESAYGESWSTVTYSWTVELPTLTDFRTKLAVYIPYYGQDGNAVERWVRIYNSSGRLVVSDYDKPINGVGGYGERYIMYTNMTPIDSIAAGIYTFKLTFRFSCGWAGEFAVGYRYDYLMRQTEPMHIETFGCNFDAVYTPPTPTYTSIVCSGCTWKMSDIINPDTVVLCIPGGTYISEDYVLINGKIEIDGSYTPVPFVPEGSWTDRIYQQHLTVIALTSMIEYSSGSISQEIGFHDLVQYLKLGYDPYGMLPPLPASFEHVLILGISGGGMVAENEIMRTGGTLRYDGSIACICPSSFAFKDNRWRNVTAPICLISGISDQWHGQMVQLRNNFISISAEYEWHEFSDGHDVVSYNEIETGLTLQEVTRSFAGVLLTQTPTYILNIQSSGLGFTSSSGLKTYTEGITASFTAMPDPGKYFWYWKVNNTALGIYWNFTANPFYLYVDHDYNVTAYFGDTPGPPPPNRTLVISNHDPSLGYVSPSPGNYSYANGTSVNVTAVPNGGYYFDFWSLDGYAPYPGNPITVTMSTDHTLVAHFKTPTIYFKVYDKTSGVQLFDGVEIYYFNSSWIELPTSVQHRWAGDPEDCIVAAGCPPGTYDFKFTKSGYYDYIVSKTIPDIAYYYFPSAYLNPIVYSGGGGEGCPRLIVAGTDLGIIDIHSPHDVIRDVGISSLLISESYENEFTKLTLIEGYPGLTISESYIDYVELNGRPVVKAMLNGKDVTFEVSCSDDIKVYLQLDDKLELYFGKETGDSIFKIEGQNILKMSALATFYATMPYSNETQYADLDHYIRVQVLPGTTGTLKLVIHYDTDYPIVEIDAENLTLTEFDLEALYQHYCLSSYEDMQQTSHFTGLRISSNTLLQINLEMPQALDFWHRPSELLKIGQDGTMTSFSSYQCAGRTLTLNFEPGDPTLSMLFHAEPDAMTLTFWNLIPFIFIVGSVAMLIPTILAAKRRNLKEFAILLVGFLIMAALIPIVPQLMA